jgi:hypothetical protein
MKQVNKKSLFVFAACLLSQQIVFAALPMHHTKNNGTAVLTAVGTGPGGSPMIAASNDGVGSIWSMQTVPGMPSFQSVRSTSCSGSGTSAVCSVVGGLNGLSSIIAVTTDGANTWALKTPTGVSTTANFNATSCTSSGPTGICTAVGQDNSSLAPLLAMSYDGGNTWSMRGVTGVPTQGVFRGVSCTGSGATAVCTAVGQDLTTSAALVAASTNGGSTWAVQTVPFPATANVFSASCTDAGATAICSISGVDNATGNPLLAVTTNGTASWTIPAITGLPAMAALASTSCTGTGATAVCTAAGTIPGSSQVPLLLASNNGGITWTIQSFTGMPAQALLSRTSCTGNGSTAICTVSGQDQSTNLPFLAVTTDGANTWQPKTVASFPVNTSFIATNCSGAGATAICTVAARTNPGPTLPYLGISTDGGNTWGLQTISGVPASGIFVATGGTA